jgi:UDP-3-O-[3-hydroxymyristoyl] glucosamine N-acyltransferase
MGGQVGLADHVDVGDEVVIAAQSGVIQDVAPRSRIAGTWARPVALTHRIWVAQAELPELVRTVQRLEDRLAKLEARLGSRE